MNLSDSSRVSLCPTHCPLASDHFLVGIHVPSCCLRKVKLLSSMTFSQNFSFHRSLINKTCNRIVETYEFTCKNVSTMSGMQERLKKYWLNNYSMNECFRLSREKKQPHRCDVRTILQDMWFCSFSTGIGGVRAPFHDPIVLLLFPS